METDTKFLQEELEQFRKEKEEVRAIIGQIGGVESAKRHHAINIGFLVIVLALFALDVGHVLGFHVPLPPMFSLALGVFLVSIKIVWMVHTQTKVGHFQFWVLSSIEYRVNDVANRLREIEGMMRADDA